METNIWSKLPEELRERVFAFLPISQVFKFRLVSQKWNFILNSQSFKELWTNLSPPNPWFVVYSSSEVVAAYDPAPSKWTNMPVYQRCSLDPEQVELMASAGGLLCFWNGYSQHETLIVCNPLTKSRRVLPQMLQIRYIYMVGMVADKSTNSYRILVTGSPDNTSNGVMTDIYDFRLGKWIHQCSSSPKLQELRCNELSIWHNGVFYCVDSEPGHHRLLANDMERREWADLDVEMPSQNIRRPSLISCGGRLLLVGGIVEDGSSICICIWELRMDSLQWVRVDVIPREVLSTISLKPLLYQGNNNLICCSTYQAWQSLVYDLSDRSWQFLPENQKMIGRKCVLGISYEPNLAAKA